MPSENVTLTANFEEYTETEYTLTLEANPEAGGTLEGAGEYEEGEEVSVTAIAKEGWGFINWTGDTQHIDDADSETATVTIPAENITLTANFQKQNFDLTIEIDGEGSETKFGAGTHSVEFDEEVTLIADADDGWQFVNWTDKVDDEISDQAEYVFNMPAEDFTLTANFEEIPEYTLTLIADPEEGGEAIGDGDYEEGEEVTVTATANEGYKFFNWTDENDDEISNNASFTYAMPAFDAQLTANFDKLYIITFEIEDEDGVTIDDATVTLNGAENDPGQYVFDDIVVGTYEYTVKKENYFTVVDEVEVSDEDVTVDVTMELITYTASFDVVDEDGNTIDDATITFDEVENESGDYVFENIEPGTYNYEVKHTDYFTVEDEVELVDDDITKNVEMKIDDTFVETPSDVELEIFPNPARNNINITAEKTINNIAIIDIAGNVVYNKVVEDMQTRISTADLATGLYIVRIYTDDGVFVEKVQVQR